MTVPCPVSHGVSVLHLQRLPHGVLSMPAHQSPGPDGQQCMPAPHSQAMLLCMHEVQTLSLFEALCPAQVLLHGRQQVLQCPPLERPRGQLLDFGIPASNMPGSDNLDTI